MEYVISFGVECKCGQTLECEMVSSGNYDGVENLVVEPCPNCCRPKCEQCYRTLSGTELMPRENPYARELHGDESLHLLCDGCCRELARDI